jgi:oligopeptide transport system substrate-binding protein
LFCHRAILSIARHRVRANSANSRALRRSAVIFALLLSLIGSPLTGLHARGVDLENDSISLAMATEPPSLNTLLATDSESFFVLTHVMEGLTQYNLKNELVPGVASHWELDDSGVTFWLRKDARWSDGEAVIAEHFAYAWREALDPGNAAPYASILYPIKNARAINTGQLEKDQLGVKVIDSHTLRVDFEQACPYFLGLTAFATYYPRRPDIVQRHGTRFAAEADTMVYNGPFKLESWVHGANLELVKNPEYWDASRVALKRIKVPFMTSSTGASLNLYKDGAIAFSSLDAESLKEAVVQGYQVRRFRNGIIYFIEFNFRQDRATVNGDLRRAMQLVFDSATLVNKVIAMPGNKPLNSLFPSTVRGVDGPFYREYPAQPPQQNLALARQHLERARKTFGGQLPPLTFLVSEAPVSVIIGEYLQNLFKQALGLDIRLDKQIFKQRIAKMQSGDFDMVLAGWGPDFDDAITYADLFASWNENNRGRYNNERYDHWVAVAQQSSDQKQRMDAMSQMQNILQQDVGILPLFEGASVYLQHASLRGVGRAIFGGDPSYKFAWLEKAEAK